jgi:hypothetical protein
VFILTKMEKLSHLMKNKKVPGKLEAKVLLGSGGNWGVIGEDNWGSGLVFRVIDPTLPMWDVYENPPG